MDQTYYSSAALFALLLIFLISVLLTQDTIELPWAKSLAEVIAQRTGLHSKGTLAPSPMPGSDKALEEYLKQSEGTILALEQENSRLRAEIAMVETQKGSWEEEVAHIHELEAWWKLRDIEPKVLELSAGAMGARYTDELEDFTTNSLPDASLSSIPGARSFPGANCGFAKPPTGAPSQERLLWRPHANKYLLAICVHGKMIHREACLRKYAALAALLNRTMVLPPAQTDPVTQVTLMDEWAVDTAAAEECLGARNIISMAELVEQEPRVRVSLMCWRDECGLEDLCKAGTELWDVLRVESCVAANISTPAAHLPEFLYRYGSLQNKAISFGDIFPIEGFHELPYGFSEDALEPFQINDTCKLAVRPATAIVDAAHKFVRMIIGIDFIAVHLLRADLLDGCAEAAEGCYTHVARLATCIEDRITTFGKELTTVFLATNAKPPEVLLLKTHLQALHKTPLHVTTLLPLDDAPWTGSLGELKEESQVVAILEEVVCAMSPLFLAYRASTFTSSVQRLRIAMQSASCHDVYDCREVLG